LLTVVKAYELETFKNFMVVLFLSQNIETILLKFFL